MFIRLRRILLLQHALARLLTQLLAGINRLAFFTGIIGWRGCHHRESRAEQRACHHGEQTHWRMPEQ